MCAVPSFLAAAVYKLQGETYIPTAETDGEDVYKRQTMELLKKDYAKELDILQIELPDVSRIPAIRFDEAKQRVAEKYDRQFRNPYDLEPEEEHLIGQYAKEEFGSDFVFVTHYPSKKRPFYAMDDPADPTYTLSFDLLYKGPVSYTHLISV